MPYLLSKSKYLSGLQCPRLIWIEIHEPAKIPETDPVTQYIFDQGQLVGNLAKRLFSDGIDILTDDFMDNIRQTEQLLEQRRPLFEAGVLVDNLYSRIDILNPVNEDEWDIVEVKSSTNLKNVHIDDVAYQRYCSSRFGLNIKNCYLALINNQYVRDGQIDPEGLFNIHDVTDQVEEASIGIQDNIDVILEAISQETCPEMIIGSHCKDPYECPMTDCWDSLPEHSVFSLYRGGKKAFAMYDSGILTVEEIPDDYKLNDRQRIQQACVISGEPHVDREAIRDFLASLQYPLAYLDFETIGPAVPLFDGLRPYQDTPFQFSVHVVQDKQSHPVHYSYLTSGTDDPRPALLAELQNVIGDSGSIIAYNKGFEEGILRDFAEAFPEYSDWVDQVLSRLVDLLVPFRNFDYYHPAQEGSASLKAVLPAITGRGYEDLNISDGQMASITFLVATYGNMPQEEKEKAKTDLEKYCGRDTEGMIWIVDKLKDLCS